MNELAISRLVQGLPTPVPSSSETLKRYAWTHELDEQLVRNRIPERYRVAWPEWPQKRQLAVLEKCEAKLTGTGSIMALVGTRGTGKTFLCCQLIIRRLWKQWEWANQADYPPPSMVYPWMPYRKLSDLLARYKPIYADFGTISGDEITAARDALCRAPLLIIDEIGDAEDSKIRGRLMVDLIDRRYANQVDTVLISNLESGPFRESVGESILSRIAEHGGIIPCDWKSYRS